MTPSARVNGPTAVDLPRRANAAAGGYVRSKAVNLNRQLFLRLRRGGSALRPDFRGRIHTGGVHHALPEAVLYFTLFAVDHIVRNGRALLRYFQERRRLRLGVDRVVLRKHRNDLIRSLLPAVQSPLVQLGYEGKLRKALPAALKGLRNVRKQRQVGLLNLLL